MNITSTVGTDRTEQSVLANMYVKGQRIYLRYPEKELGETSTTVKIDDDQLKIIRHGEIASEQLFVPGQTTSGYYETTQGRLRLETRTKHLDVRLKDGIGQVAWSYDLFVAKELAGSYRLAYEIERQGE